MDKVDRLYQIYDILSTSEKASVHEDEFREILDSVKGANSEKRLACQFIPRFFKDFPHLAETALDAQLDLAEDDDVNIRKLAVKHLTGFCKDSPEFVTKIADILSQMLQTEDTTELSIVQAALLDVMKLDVKGALQGILIQITSADDEGIRKRAIDFLSGKFKLLPPDIVTKDVEEFVLEACKKVFGNLSGEDFLNLLPLMSNLKTAKTVPGQNAIVRIIADGLEFDSKFTVTSENITHFKQCVLYALPYFSHFTNSVEYVVYICLQILPRLDEIIKLEKGCDYSLDILKLLAELSAFVIQHEHIPECTKAVHETLIEYIPLPPVSEDEDNSSPDDANLKFTHIECLLFTFIQMLKHNVEFLTSPDQAECFKDLKSRLQFLARSIQNGLKMFRGTAESTKSQEGTAEEKNLKALSLNSMNNINSLIKDFFRSPPAFKTIINLSWKPPVSGKSGAMYLKKRESDSNLAGMQKHVKREVRAGRQLYVPPTGKYSSNVNFSFSGRGRGKF